MLEIEVAIGEGTRLVRGEKHQYELCEKKKIKVKKEGGEVEYKEEWVAYSWYTSLPSILSAVLDTRLRHSEARSLTDVMELIEKNRKLLIEQFRTTIEKEDIW